MSTLIDALGHPVSGSTATALDHYEQAAHELRCLVGDPLATIDRALAAAPAMSIGHTLRAWLHLLGTESSALATARDEAQAAARHAATERERMHAQAAALVAAGRWREGARLLEDLSAQHPRDLLALQAGHQLDFFLGDSRMLRDRIARVRPHWNDAMPAHHAVLGMHAFGMEECGDYAQAERVGRRAIELQPRDTWAWHAVAHVHEMRNAPPDGIVWLEPNAAHWSRDSFFAVHNWWHLAMFHLDLGDIDEVLRLYDGPIDGKNSNVVLEMIDHSAMLWRLHLRGIDVGNRWRGVADRWEPLADAGNYAFNDAHAMMSFVGANRPAAARKLLDAQVRAMEGPGDNAAFTREVGYPVALALKAFGEGGYAQCIDLLRPLYRVAHHFGGSHAQRDILELTLIEAALRDGQHTLATALVEQRLAAKPTSPYTGTLRARARAGGNRLALHAA